MTYPRGLAGQRKRVEALVRRLYPALEPVFKADIPYMQFHLCKRSNGEKFGDSSPIWLLSELKHLSDQELAQRIRMLLPERDQLGL